jgi:hypothetical protein
MALLGNAPNFLRTAQNPCTGQDFWSEPSAASGGRARAQGLSPNQDVMPHQSATLSSTAGPLIKLKSQRPGA